MTLTDLVTGTTRSVPQPDGTVITFAGSRLLVLLSDGRIEVYDVNSLKRLRVLNGTEDR